MPKILQLGCFFDTSKESYNQISNFNKQLDSLCSAGYRSQIANLSFKPSRFVKFLFDNEPLVKSVSTGVCKGKLFVFSAIHPSLKQSLLVSMSTKGRVASDRYQKSVYPLLNQSKC